MSTHAGLVSSALRRVRVTSRKQTEVEGEREKSPECNKKPDSRALEMACKLNEIYFHLEAFEVDSRCRGFQRALKVARARLCRASRDAF